MSNISTFNTVNPNSTRRIISMVLAFISAVTMLMSCNARTSSQQEELTLDIDWDYEELLDASEEMHGSICFDPYPEPEYWIAANLDELLYSDTTSISTDVKFGPDAGDGTLSLEAYPDSTFHAIFTRGGKRYELLEEAGIANYSTFMATLAAMDLNHDGNMELILHTGDSFGLYVFAVHKGNKPLKYAGTMGSNYGFFVTDNGTIVSLFGSQGGAYLARFENDELIEIGDAWFDKCLMASPKFHNLEYDFEDTSDKDHEVKPLLNTEKYIVCEANGTLCGDHVLKIDLDMDGEEEQLYMSRPSWGATSEDLAQINERFSAYSLIGPIYANDDTIAMEFGEFDSYFKGRVQISAVDVNNDGVYEVVLSVGEPKLNSSYVFSYKKGKGVTLLKHIEHKGILKEEDLR